MQANATTARGPVNLRLRAAEGYVATPDGASIYIWGYTGETDTPAQLPAPTIVLNQEDVATIELANELPENVSIMFPGQAGVLRVTGSAVRPVRPAYENGRLVSLTDYAPPGGTITYQFTAYQPGTYLYHSGTEMRKQVQMGLYGVIIVRPAGFDPSDPATWSAYGAGTDTEFDREYLLVISEIDPLMHDVVRLGQPYHAGVYKPRYWTMNGRCAPDTMIPDGVQFLPRQPYGSMIMAEPGERVLLRYAGAGTDNHPLHPHGNHTRVVAFDGRLLRNGSQDLSHKRFTVLVGAGQTYDQIFQWDGLGYDPVSKPIPTILPNLRNQAIGDAGWTMWSGSPYLGLKGDIPVGVTSFNMNGEYYFMLHSHEELQITNWGEFPGGMMTMIGIFPPGTLGPAAGRSLLSYSGGNYSAYITLTERGERQTEGEGRYRTERSVHGKYVSIRPVAADKAMRSLSPRLTERLNSCSGARR
ncbi:MAG: multicopper oxidase domain-containing protein [Bacillota bacterium]